ncbi:MAG: hypothetical protein ACOX7O_10490, partial [Oscillospiraceae bacterium]
GCFWLEHSFPSCFKVNRKHFYPIPHCQVGDWFLTEGLNSISVTPTRTKRNAFHGQETGKMLRQEDLVSAWRV